VNIVGLSDQRAGLHARSLIVAALIGIPLLAWAGTVGGRYLWAAYHYRAARQALEAYRLRQARDHINQCLSVWTQDPKAHILAVRAARMDQDYDDAELHLNEVQRVTGVSETTNLEWAMLRAHYGDLDSVENYLQSLVQEGHPESRLILDALAAGYLRMYRNVDAEQCIHIWLEREPNCPQALYYRGLGWQRLHGYQKAVDDFTVVVEQDPDRDNARIRLAACLLEVQQLDQALSHMKILYAKHPKDPETVVALANCYYNLGDIDEGCDLLDCLLAENPSYAPALSGRGQLAMENGETEQALRYFRRALAESPLDMRANYELSQCLEILGKDKEAKEQRGKLVTLQKNIERLMEISNHEMTKNPNDPALHTELGILMLSLSKEELGERWLVSALQKDKNYGPAHKALADYYERKGETAKASEHREKAKNAEPAKIEPRSAEKKP